MASLMICAVAFAVLRYNGPAPLSAAGDPTSWSLYQVAPAQQYHSSGVNIDRGINSADVVPSSMVDGANDRALVISGDFFQTAARVGFNAARQGIVVSENVAGVQVANATNGVSLDRIVFTTISTTTIRPVLRFVTSADNINAGCADTFTESVDVRILNSDGNNVLERVVHVPGNGFGGAMNGSMDIPVTLNVPATVDAAPTAYTLELSWMDSANQKQTWTYPILVDRVNAQEADLNVSFFNDVDTQGNGDINNALGQRVQLDRFTTPQTAPRVVNLGVVPDRQVRAVAWTPNVARPIQNVYFHVRNEGSVVMSKDVIYTNRYYWNAGVWAPFVFAASDFRANFQGYTCDQAVPANDGAGVGRWAPRLANGWETTEYRWTPANMATVPTMDFDSRTDVANIMIRNVVLTNNNAAFVRATYFPSMDVNVDMAQNQGVTGHVDDAGGISVKNIAPISIEIPVPNPSRDNEVYTYPMQLTFRVRAHDVDAVYGTASNKWRTINDKFDNLNGANGLANFLAEIGPQKIVGGQTYALATLCPAADLAKYIQVRRINNEYYISFIMVLADMAKPAGKNDIECVNNMFIVYDGAKDNVLKDPMYMGTPTTTTPTPTSGPTPTAGPTATPTPGSSSSSGGCSAFGFAPMALLLLAPLALLRKRG